MSYKTTIGLEVHVELKTHSKMFCDCLNDPYEAHPNVNICPICMGHPGTLPVINKKAVEKVIKTGLALKCKISTASKFDRKNYFYPDLPKGYQISQYDMPICKEGRLEINGKEVRITRVHLEEDTGRLLHPKGKDYSLVDFNRAGIPLMELVTEPDLESAEEARKFAEELRLILRYLDVSDADMEKGQMRIEANVSLSKNKDTLGTKVEIKNLNSFVAVEKALEYEIERQARVLREGGKIVQETRGWDEFKQVTVSQREKEEAHDYRYFPEPDLPPLYFTENLLKKIRLEIPELPQKKRERLKKEFNLSDKEVEIFVSNKDLSEYFEKVVSELKNWAKKIGEKEFFGLIKVATNYIITDLRGLLKKASVVDEDFLITPENFAELISLVHTGKISSKIAKAVLKEMFGSGKDPSHIIEEKGLAQITDEAKIEKIVKDVISKNPKAVNDYKSGKQSALQFLVGQVMSTTKGTAEPEKVQELLRKNLG